LAVNPQAPARDERAPDGSSTSKVVNSIADLPPKSNGNVPKVRP
jgi:hypothetical protein